MERQLELLCRAAERDVGARLAAAIRYAALAPGKRVRAALLCEAYRCVGGRGDVSGLAAALEMLHTYSLVHDDLPCMDDDDLRRGRPTVHRAFGYDTAILAGAAMIALAFWQLRNAALTLGLGDQGIELLERELARAAGAGGMIGGQWRDLASEGTALSADELQELHAAKTGRLFEAAAVMGGVAGGARAAQLAALRSYGSSLGLAYQIADDLLDATGGTEGLGKVAGGDAARGKCTFPSLLGVTASRQVVQRLAAQAMEALAHEACLSPGLERLARYVVQRAGGDD